MLDPHIEKKLARVGEIETNLKNLGAELQKLGFGYSSTRVTALLHSIKTEKPQVFRSSELKPITFVRSESLAGTAMLHQTRRPEVGHSVKAEDVAEDEVLDSQKEPEQELGPGHPDWCS